MTTAAKEDSRADAVLAQAVSSVQSNVVNSDALALKKWEAKVAMAEKMMAIMERLHGTDHEKFTDALAHLESVVAAEPDLKGMVDYDTARALCAGAAKPTKPSSTPARTHSAARAEDIDAGGVFELETGVETGGVEDVGSGET